MTNNLHHVRSKFFGLLQSTIKGMFLIFTLINAGPAAAGGLERGGYNIDQLFDNANFSFKSSASYVTPNRKLDHVKDTNPKNGIFSGKTNDISETESYLTPYIGFKIGLGDHVDCLFDYSEPWGAHTHPGNNWVGVNSNIETKLTSNNYGATCSYKFNAGNGAQIRLIGGGFHQKIDGFKVKQVARKKFPSEAELGEQNCQATEMDIVWASPMKFREWPCAQAWSITHRFPMMFPAQPICHNIRRAW